MADMTGYEQAYLIQALRHRASYPIYQEFGVNVDELWFLSSLYTYQLTLSRSAVSRRDFYDWLSQNMKRHYKFDGYLHGLQTKELIGTYEFVSSPGSKIIGISDLGLAVLRRHGEVLTELLSRYSFGDKLTLSRPHLYRRTA
jgi:hypothetical protein